MSHRQPWFPFYPADFLLDVKVIPMSYAERGMYVTLLCYAWWSGSIPAAPDAVLRLLGLDPTSDPTLVQHLLDTCWTPHPTKPNELISERLEAEREKGAAISEKRSQAGKASAAKRLQSQHVLNTEKTDVQPTQHNTTQHIKTLRRSPSWPAELAEIIQGDGVTTGVGAFSPGEIGRYCKAAVEQYGLDEVRTAARMFARHGRDVAPTFHNPKQFARNIAHWAWYAKPSNPEEPGYAGEHPPPLTAR